MNRDEFIALAKEYGYDEEGIKGLLETYDEMKALDANLSFSEIVLIEQAVY